VFRLAGLPVAGYRGDGRALLLRWPVTPATEPSHRVMSWYRLTQTTLAKWHLPDGPPTPAPRLGLSVTAAQHLEAQFHLEQNNLAQKNFILIAPTATGLHRGQNKVWPGYATLTRTLQAQGLTVVMCPPPSELKIAQHNAPTAGLLPPMSLGAFAALTLHAALVICNDSGVSHLAAAVGARQLTLFGVTQQSHTGPWSPNAHCLGSIDTWPTITAVTETVLRLLTQLAPPHSPLDMAGIG
jgi:heptosyltransferase-2